MNHSPRVAVLLPVRNAARTIETALTSVLSQSFAEIEVIAVDDGSADSSLAILDEWRRRDARLRVFRQASAGVAAALSRGLAEARAPLITRLDADDILHPRRIEVQLRCLGARRSVMLGCLAAVIPGPAPRGGYLRYIEWCNSLIEPAEIARSAFIECPLIHTTLFTRRDDLLAIGGYREVPWSEDYDLFLRACRSGMLIEKVARVLYYVRDHPERATWRDPRCSLEAFLRAKAHFLARGPLAGRPVVIFGAGRVGRRLAKHLAREGVALEAFVDHRAPGLAPVRGLEVRPVESLRGMRAFVVVALPSRRVREMVRRELSETLGMCELEEFVVVA